MNHIDGHGGRFVCVMPRSRKEDAEFRQWIQTHVPAWEQVRDLPHPRRRDGPRDCWSVLRHPLPSREGWPVLWVSSTLLALHQESARRERLARASQELHDLHAKLIGPRPRRRSRKEIQERIDAILQERRVRQHLVVEVVQDEEHYFRQAARGRPGPKTRYVRKTRRFWRLRWHVDEKAIAYERKSDGMYPLLTNDWTLTDAQVLDAHKRQPMIEKRFE